MATLNLGIVESKGDATANNAWICMRTANLTRPHGTQVYIHRGQSQAKLRSPVRHFWSVDILPSLWSCFDFEIMAPAAEYAQTRGTAPMKRHRRSRIASTRHLHRGERDSKGRCGKLLP